MYQHIPQRLRPNAACATFGVSKATLLRLERERPDFPRPSRPTCRITLYDRHALEVFFAGNAEGRKAVGK